jgi:hypothetical protein
VYSVGVFFVTENPAPVRGSVTPLPAVIYRASCPSIYSSLERQNSIPTSRHFFFWNVHNSRWKTVQIILSRFLCLVVTGAACFSTYLVSFLARKMVSAWYPLLISLFWFIVLVSYLAVYLLLLRRPAILGYILPEFIGFIRTGEARNSEEEETRRAIWAIIFFLLHIFVTLLWYAVAYNPRWTYNASWTFALGELARMAGMI